MSRLKAYQKIGYTFSGGKDCEHIAGFEHLACFQGATLAEIERKARINLKRVKRGKGNPGTPSEHYVFYYSRKTGLPLYELQPIEPDGFKALAFVGLAWLNPLGTFATQDEARDALDNYYADNYTPPEDDDGEGFADFYANSKIEEVKNGA